MTRITLTFDNGPDPDVTPIVLDTLRRHECPSMFFVLGQKLRDRRYLIERAHDEGHWIGNHTFNHMLPLGRNTELGISAGEIRRTQDLIGDLTHPRRFFRPFGSGGKLNKDLLNREAVDWLIGDKSTCVIWNTVPEDWVYPRGWVNRALNLCFAQEHAVVVLHDLPTGAMEHLDQFLAEAKDRGAIFEQDFPASCILIEQGKVVSDIRPYVTEGEW